MFLPKPSFTREHRLGLVVYGGVSLAIYMNGICREFYDAVRGRGIYKLIKALTDADIIVDIISGTSAGGINGVLLSYALANSDENEYIPFEEFAKLWIESGDIKKLLFGKEYDGYYKASLLDGVGYYKAQLKRALNNPEQKKASLKDWVSPAHNLDLFVTGTDLLGRIYETFDNTGRIIEVKDHRTIFHLKWQESGENAFKYRDEVTLEALAKLCQITSCFPGAFPPVTVHIDEESRVDEKLVEWGQLRKNRRLPKLLARQSKNMPWDEDDPRHQKIKKRIEDDLGRGYRLHFVDGGVLDNRPFTYAIETIYHRTTERRVFRKLFYVDPSPDRFLDNTQYRRMMKPGPFQVVADSLSALPRYESINNDLELIKQHNEKVRRYKFLLADIEVLLDREVKDSQNQDLRDQQVFVYKRARLLKLKDKLVSRVYLESEDCLQDIKDEQEREAEFNDPLQFTGDPSQLTDDFQTLIEGLTARLDVAPDLRNSLDLAHSQVKQLLNQEQKLSVRRDLDKSVELLTKPLEPDENARWVDTLENVYNETDSLDIEYALRKHFFIVNYIHELLDADKLNKWLDQKSNCNKHQNNKPHNSTSHVSRIKIPPEILQELIVSLQELIKDLNECVRYVQEIEREVEKFFSSRLVSKHFKRLIKDEKSKRDFPSRFYDEMCFLHKMLLYVNRPDYPKDLVLSDDLKFELESTGDIIQKKLRYAALLKRIPCLASLSLEELIRKTADSVSKQLATEAEDTPGRSEDKWRESEDLENKISVLQVFSFIAEQIINCQLNSVYSSVADASLSQLDHLGQYHLGQYHEEPELKNALQTLLKEKLSKYFVDFKKLDEFLFPLDYLAGISGKQLIETYRISPEDARYGLSTYIQRGKRLEQKLAGDSLGSFGGFLKKSWRENDILWGRLDGLNRIVESLITDEQVKRFPEFWKQQAEQLFKDKPLEKAKADYLDWLLNEALSIDHSNSEQDLLKQQLKQELREKIIALDNALTQEGDADLREQEITKHRSILVQTLVRAGHLLILQEERKTLPALNEALNQSSLYQYSKLRVDKKLETAFNDHYKIGLETLQDVPKSDWKEIEGRGISIVKDILKTYRHKRYTRLAPRLVGSLLKTENIYFAKRTRFIVLLLLAIIFLPIFAYLLAGALILLLVSLPILALVLAPFLMSYINSKISRKPRQFRRLKITFFRHVVILENLFLKSIISIVVSAFRIIFFRVLFSVTPRWKRITGSAENRKTGLK